MDSQSEGLFDFDSAKDDVNRRAIAIGFALIVLSGFVDWYEIETTLSDSEYSESTDVKVSGEDAREGIDNAKYLWFLGFIGLGAVLLTRSKLEEQIGDENYGNFFLGLGVVCLLLAYSVYSEIKEAEEDAEDAGEALAYFYGDDEYEISVDIDMTYNMGFYMALLGPLGVLYGGYNIYNEIKNGA